MIGWLLPHPSLAPPLLTPGISTVWAAAGGAAEPREAQMGAAAVVSAVVVG